MPRSMEVGLIDLIPEGEGKSVDIRTWRPITLLNTIYKIFAKTLSLSLQPFLHDLIHITQTCSIQERSILDNLFFIREAIALACKKKEDIVILLLDIKKHMKELIESSFMVLLFVQFNAQFCFGRRG